MDMKAPLKRYLRGPEARYLRKSGRLHPDWCEVKVSRGERWWELDDVLADVIGRGRVRSLAGSFRFVQAEMLPSILQAFGADRGRLVVRRLPTDAEIKARTLPTESDNSVTT